MTIEENDLDRVRRDYTDSDANLTLDDVREDLESADFEGDSLDAFTDAIAGDSDLAVSRDALQSAQAQAVESLSDGGAIGGQIVRADDGFTAIGKPENVEQRIERTGRTEGDVIARNTNTGTEGRIGSVELAPPPEVE
jgi:hypothetical protein